MKDKLVAIGEVIVDSELVRIAFKGFTKEWNAFVKCGGERVTPRSE